MKKQMKLQSTASMEEPAKLTQPYSAGCSWDSRRAPIVKQLLLDPNSQEKITFKPLKPVGSGPKERGYRKRLHDLYKS